MSNYQTDHIEAMAELFKALSNPQRLRMFAKLASACREGTCCEGGGDETMRRCVGELGEDMGLAASTVSHHIKELRQAGLLKVERRGQRVECWLDLEMLGLVAGFLEECGVVRQVCADACNSEQDGKGGNADG